MNESSAFAAAGGGLNYVSSIGRPFSLLDLSISYPLIPETITTTTLALVALLAPAAIIVIVALTIVPGPAVRRTLRRRDVIRRSLWELQTGLAGLALAVAVAFFITQGLKNLFGKPRPHLLALCQPDVNNLANNVVGGFGQDISARWTLVDKSICTQPDQSALNDGFRSFPSGHASFSWSGLLYLSLFLASKFAIAIPYLPTTPWLTAWSPAARTNTARSNETELLPLHNPRPSQSSTKPPLQPSAQNNDHMLEQPVYNLAASPPNYGIIVVLIPIGAAAYITSTRYSEYWHFGFDVLGGAIIGVFSAWGSFRWYHAPIRRGQGWSWGPRSRERAFGIGVGTATYVGPEGWDSAAVLTQ